MPDNIIEVVNQMGEDDGSPDGIVFCNIHKESTVEDMYRDVDSQDNSRVGRYQRTEVRKTKRPLCTMMLLMMIKLTI